MRVVSHPANELSDNDKPLADTAGEKLYRILVRDLDVAWSIGVYDHEYEKVQIVRINLDLAANEMTDPESDDFSQVVCYATISEAIRKLAAEGHIRLVETLAHRIAGLCLKDERIQRATVRIEKPEALKNAAAVGVEITRRRGDYPETA